MSNFYNGPTDFLSGGNRFPVIIGLGIPARGS
jgi:hypothetical protein